MKTYTERIQNRKDRGLLEHDRQIYRFMFTGTGVSAILASLFLMSISAKMGIPVILFGAFAAIISEWYYKKPKR